MYALAETGVSRVIGQEESYHLVKSSNFQTHSKEAVGNYDTLLVYELSCHCDKWELVDDKEYLDTLVDGSGRLIASAAHYCMVVPVTGKIPDYGRWSFAPDWAGYPLVDGPVYDESEEDYPMPSIRGKRASLEKKRGFKGSPAMRMVG